MHEQTLSELQHTHDFSLVNREGERRTLYVLALTAVTMLVEVVAGIAFGSMALLADGWHMGTHVAAFSIAIFAYRYARKHADSPDYTFGTGKVNVLGGFASAVALAVVALVMVSESLQRIVDPQPIFFNQAIAVATLGLIINLISALLLKGNPGHALGHDRHQDNDHNLRAAYMHVLADAMTSVLAIVALTAGKYLGWSWLDPVMGIVGAVIISRWSFRLVKQTGPILLDANIDADYRRALQRTIESDSDNRVSDLHVWRVGAEHYAAIIALVTHNPKTAEYYKGLLRDFRRLAHVTIEVNRCDEPHCSTDRLRLH